MPLSLNNNYRILLGHQHQYLKQEKQSLNVNVSLLIDLIDSHAADVVYRVKKKLGRTILQSTFCKLLDYIFKKPENHLC